MDLKGFLSPGISIHAPARGATYLTLCHAGKFKDFNPRSREGSDRILRMLHSLLQHFNPRSREGSDTLPTGRLASCKQYFNPRSREGSDVPRAVTAAIPRDFNPRSREGSDSVAILCISALFDFNPRSREGSDVGNMLYQQLFDISIHAPARGATGMSNFMWACISDFNPRSREGSDHKL